MRDIKEINKSLTKKFKKEIMSKFIKAIKDFDLIKENDKIAVCISGGKDSFLMAKCFQEIKRHNKFPFEVIYLVMDPGYTEENITKIKENAKYLDIDIQIFSSDIFAVTKKIANDNPCYLCARMRRGYLYSKAKELGCNKIALGHHFNDVIETILLNQFYNGNFSGMLPKLKSDNFESMQLIRPLFYIQEHDIISWCKYNELEFLDCACTVTTRNTGKRKEIKELITLLKKDIPNLDVNIFNSMFNVNKITTFERKNNDR